MGDGRYSRRVLRTPWRVLGGAVAAIGLLAGCGGDGETSDTLDPLVGTPGDTGGTATSAPGVASTGPATVDPAEAGSGFVSMHVSLAHRGIDETLTLDRGSVRTADLDPLSLNATCSALDGGEPLTVSVIDLRRVGAGSELVSATVRTDEPATEPGEYEGSVEVADTTQSTARYEAKIVIDEGGLSGSFEGEDESGNIVSGTFICAPQPVATTTTTIVGVIVGEEVPGSTTAPTIPPAP